MLTPDGMITANFSLREMIHSDTAVKHGIRNVPNEKQIGNLKALCENVLQPLRDKLGKPIKVTSGFRCPELNAHKDIGGAKNSQHTRGEAADIKVDGYTANELFHLILLSGIVFDQCIEEFGQWVHISFSRWKPNRHQAIIAIRTKSGRVRYTRLKK